MSPALKRRKLTPPREPRVGQPDVVEDADTNDFLESSFSSNANQWNLEQSYEKRPRRQNDAKETLRLPIKTAQGRLEPIQVLYEKDAGSETSFESLEPETPITDQSDLEDAIKSPALPVKHQIVRAQEELVRIVDLVNENPEEHVSSLKVLANITASQVPTITRYGLITQMRVYQDIIPGYRIRPYSSEDLGTKISKDVRKLRAFEQAIVKAYHEYVQQLMRISKLGNNEKSPSAGDLVTTAISCICSLLHAVPHFNFRSELLKVIVDNLSKTQVDSHFNRSLECFSKLFADDEEGSASLEALSMLCKMIKNKNYQVDEGVLNLFLSLRLLSEFSHKGSHSGINMMLDGELLKGKKAKQKRDFKTKKERKISRQNKAIEKEMKEAEAIVGHEERDQKQGEMLKLVFGTYFRILKERVPKLMGAVLEGLVKFAHLINQDFFWDLIESLRDLIEEAEDHFTVIQCDQNLQPAIARNTTRESLLCITTAFSLLQGQDASAASTLHLDLSYFIHHLYCMLHPLALHADIETSSKSPQALDPDSPSTFSNTRTEVNVSTLVVLLLRSLSSILLPAQTIRSVPPSRLAAFSRKILTSSLHMPEKSCTAMLGLMNQVAKTHKRKISPLWRTEERKGDGVFDGARQDIEGSNPFAGTAWEGELLKLHFAPSVKDGIRNLEGIIEGG